MALPTVLPDATPDDAMLLARLRAGDEAAFDSLFRTWYAPLARFAGRMIGDSARAEEVAQDALFELWNRRQTLSEQGSAHAWLFHTVRNRALNVLRHDGIVARAEPQVLSMVQHADRSAESDADVALVEAELHVAIEKAVAALPPRCREVFLLSRRHGMRQSDIAVRLGIGAKAVEANMTRALRELRRQLAPWLNGNSNA
jgi:RNA polymerase sigma-70 factor, ECF subfamily